MTTRDEMSSYGVGMLDSQLRAAYANDNIGAVIIDTNSPGGEVTAMQMLVGAVQDRNKPVLGFGRFAASAAYGTLAATDEIIASDKMAQFGSVGAMITLDKTFIEFYKENFLTFYGEDAPNKNAEWRAILSGNEGPMQESVNKATKDFQAQVSKQRAITGGESYQRHTLSGAMFDAVEARRRGLVDGIGTMNYAISRAMAWMQKSKKKKAA
jgi:ClpP class serine protease